jgi:hypothetical protein
MSRIKAALQFAEKLSTPSFRAKRGIPLSLIFLELSRRGIPRFARNDGKGTFSANCLAAGPLDCELSRRLFSLSRFDFLALREIKRRQAALHDVQGKKPVVLEPGPTAFLFP